MYIVFVTAWPSCEDNCPWLGGGYGWSREVSLMFTLELFPKDFQFTFSHHAFSNTQTQGYYTWVQSLQL